MEKVEDSLRTQEKKRRQMILPHCTWEKFGEILANNGGRIYSLFDKLVSFSTMNMYSSAKGQVQDNREYQDFLKMFTGKVKTRETSACLHVQLIMQLEFNSIRVLFVHNKFFVRLHGETSNIIYTF